MVYISALFNKKRKNAFVTKNYLRNYVRKNPDGNLNMKNNKIINMQDPTEDEDAASKKYVDENIHITKDPSNNALDFHARRISNIAEPISIDDAVTRNYVDYSHTEIIRFDKMPNKRFAHYQGKETFLCHHAGTILSLKVVYEPPHTSYKSHFSLNVHKQGGLLTSFFVTSDEVVFKTNIDLNMRVTPGSLIGISSTSDQRSYEQKAVFYIFVKYDFKDITSEKGAGFVVDHLQKGSNFNLSDIPELYDWNPT